MYPVRTTLLLTVDENTARKFLRDEAAVDGTQAESRRSRWEALIRSLRQLRSFIVPHRTRIERAPRKIPQV